MRDDLGELLLLAALGGGVYWYATRPTPPDLSSPSAVAGTVSTALEDVTAWVRGAFTPTAAVAAPPFVSIPPPVAALPPAAAPPPTETEWRMLTALFDAYSPALGPDGQLYFGGWLTAADPTEFLAAVQAGVDPATIPGPDKIYATARGETPHLAFQKIGYSVNDPTFEGDTMLYTQLSNAAQVAGGRAIFEQNEIGRAILRQGIWQDLGIAEAAGVAGGGGHGAWSPAVAGGYVYYNSGTDIFSSSIDYRQPIGPEGLPTGPPEHLSFPDNLELANIDVLFGVAGGWVMVGNTLDQHAIIYLRSVDGVSFVAPITLLADAAETLLSPQFQQLSATTFNLLFSRGGTEIDKVGPLAFAMTAPPNLAALVAQPGGFGAWSFA
jgi:hypothetical protein